MRTSKNTNLPKLLSELECSRKPNTGRVGLPTALFGNRLNYQTTGSPILVRPKLQSATPGRSSDKFLSSNLIASIFFLLIGQAFPDDSFIAEMIAELKLKVTDKTFPDGAAKEKAGVNTPLLKRSISLKLKPVIILGINQHMRYNEKSQAGKDAIYEFCFTFLKADK